MLVETPLLSKPPVPTVMHLNLLQNHQSTVALNEHADCRVTVWSLDLSVKTAADGALPVMPKHVTV